MKGQEPMALTGRTSGCPECEGTGSFLFAEEGEQTACEGCTGTGEVSLAAAITHHRRTIRDAFAVGNSEGDEGYRPDPYWPAPQPVRRVTFVDMPEELALGDLLFHVVTRAGNGFDVIIPGAAWPDVPTPCNEAAHLRGRTTCEERATLARERTRDLQRASALERSDPWPDEEAAEELQRQVEALRRHLPETAPPRKGGATP